MSDNPYQASELAAVSGGGDGDDPKLERSANMLRQTKPWVRFISVMMFIGSAFMVLGGFFMMVSGAAGMGGGGGGPRAAFGGVSALIGVAYLVMAMFYIVPGVFLWRYADRIESFVQQRTTAALAAALEAQKSFWKFVGIMMLIVMVLYGAGIMFAIIAGVVASAR